MSKRPYAALLSSLFFSGLCSAAPEVTPFALVEVEASALNSQDATASDIVLATLSAGFEAKLSDTFSANASLLYEEDATDLEVDEAYIQWNFTERLSGKFGQLYLPLGQFNTGLVMDTLILELAETRESSAVVNFSQDAFVAALYAYNGEVDGASGEEDGDKKDRADNFGLHLGYQSEPFNLYLDYASNLLDSDGLQGQVTELAPGNTSAWIVSTDFTFGDWTLIAEYLVSTLDAGSLLDSAGDAVTMDQDLRASQIEVNYAFQGAELAASYQTTADAQWLGLPKTRVSLGAGFNPQEHTSLKVELWQDTDYSESAGGSGEHSLGLVAQLGFEF